MDIEMNKENDMSASLAATRTQRDDPKSGFYAAILFLIWPLLSLVLAFKDYKSSWGKNILWFFVAFYGLSFAIGAESQNSDIVRYVAELRYLHGIHMSLGDAIRYFMQSGEIDVLRTFIAIVVSRFTGSQIVLTLIYGLIFGFFYSRNVWFVLERLKGKINPVTILLFICFTLVIPMWNINTFRMWTAAHIFIYGALLFLFEHKWRGVIIASSAVLVHYTFIIPIAVLYGYSLFGNRLTLYFIFFIATFFMSEINLNTFNDVVNSYAPKIVQERTSGYRNEQNVKSFREDTGDTQVWYAQWYRRVLKWSVTGFLILLFFRGRDFFNNNEMWLRLFSFTLLFFGVANILSSLPSGGRFLAVVETIALALIALYIQNKEDKAIIRHVLIVASPFLLLFIIISVRVALYSLSASVVFGNPVISLLFNQQHISLNDVMKMIL